MAPAVRFRLVGLSAQESKEHLLGRIVMSRLKGFKSRRSEPDIAERCVAFLGKSRQPADRSPIELRGAGARVAGDERQRIYQAELPDLTSRHLGFADMPTLDRALEPSVWAALAGHRLDAAGATAALDDNYASRTDLPAQLTHSG